MKTPYNKPQRHCTSIDCTSRRSLCCNAKCVASIADEGTGCYVCSECKGEFIPREHSCVLGTPEPSKGECKHEGFFEAVKQGRKPLACPDCHVSYGTPPQDLKESGGWEDRFDKEFPTSFNRFPNPGKGIEDQEYIEISSYAHSRSKFKSFIRKEISSAVEAERERVREVCKKLSWDESGKGDSLVKLSDVLQALSEDNKK